MAKVTGTTSRGTDSPATARGVGRADGWLKLGATVSVAAPLCFALLWLFDRAGFGALARMGWQVLVPG